jgi:hypothetical protein
MQNQPVIEKSRIGKRSRARKRRPLAEFLKDSGIWPLVLLGKGIEHFGWLPVAGFLLGGFSVYGYAVVQCLPYSKCVSPAPALAPAPPKIVQLHGRVRDATGNPINERFWIGVLAKQLGPVQNTDGSFALEVPANSSYDVALWTAETINIYNGFAAEQDGSGYRLMEALPFLPPQPAPAPLAQVRPRARETRTQPMPTQIAQR